MNISLQRLLYLDNRDFLLLVVTIQSLLLLLSALNSIAYQLPVLMQIVAFLSLLLIPGAVLLRALNFRLQSSAEMIVLTVAVSIAFLMLFGAALNAIGGFFSIGLLSPTPLLTGISVIILSLSAAVYIRDRKKQSLAQERSAKKVSFSVLLICLLPVLSIIGAYLMNSVGINYVLLLLLLVLSFVPIIITFRKIPSNYYPALIFSVSLSLLFYNSLISNSLTGWDIHIEYYFANLVETQSYWNAALPLNYNAMLSVVMLGPIISKISGISLLWVFKIIYPALFALVPVALYELFQKRTGKVVAFLASFFFVANYVFYTEMVQLARQEIASIFLVLLFLLIVDGLLRSSSGKLLFVILGFSLIVSHYALTYLFLFSIIIVSVVMVLPHVSSLRRIGGNLSEENKSKRYAEKFYLPGIFVLLLVILAFVWYFFIAGSSSLEALTGVLYTIISNSLAGFVNPTSSQALSMIANSSLPLHEVNKFLYLLFQVFILVGFLILAFIRRFGAISKTYIAFAFVSLIIAVASIGIPYFSNALNASRLYLFSLFFLAPLAIIGAFYVLKGLSKILHMKNRPTLYIQIIGVLLAVFLLFNTGLLYEISNSNPTAMALNNRIDYPRFSSGEVLAAQWVENQLNNNSRAVVYGDEYGRLLLSENNYWQVKTFWGDTNIVENGSVAFIYYRSMNVDGYVMASWKNQTYISIDNSTFHNIIRNSQLVYQSPSGDAQVYKLTFL